jgi:sugar/nucleoside kinase (ribokinase family)
VKRPDFLAIGHIARDLLQGDYRWGGTVAYSALTAKNLGLDTAVVTSAGPEFDSQTVLQGTQVVNIPSSVTTTFRNTYDGGTRTQHLFQLASKIGPQAVPLSWRDAPIVLLGPLNHELEQGLWELFPHSLLGLTPQGLLRAWDEDGRVHLVVGDGVKRALQGVGVVILSREDLVEGLWPHLGSVPMVVITKGAEGANLYYEGQEHHFLAYEVQEIEPTGAGDVFAAAFLIKYHQTKDPFQSTRFANFAASFCVTRPGLEGIPSEEELKGWPEALP